MEFFGSRAVAMVSSSSQTRHANYWKTPKKMSEVPGHLSKLLKNKEVNSLLSLLFSLFLLFMVFFMMLCFFFFLLNAGGSSFSRDEGIHHAN